MGNHRAFDQSKQSIRINVKAKSSSLPQKRLTEGASKNPIETALRKKERLLDQKRIGSAQSQKREKRDTPTKMKSVIQWETPGNPFFDPRQKSLKMNASWVQVVLSIIGAILVGTAMGFSVLHLFFSENPVHSSRSIDDHLPAPPAKTKVEQPHAAGADGTDQPKRYSLPALDVVMLQAGNFKERARAVKMMQSIRSQGMAATMTTGTPYRIYLGLAPSRDQALQLSSHFQEKDMTVYLKELRLGGEGATTSKTIATYSPFLEKSHRLFEQLSQASVQRLGQKPAESVSAGFFDKGWLKEYQNMVQEAPKMKKALPANAQASLDNMVRALDQAVRSGQDLGNNPNPALLWQVQEGLVRYALSYEELLDELK